jgi:hypothetical protein
MIEFIILLPPIGFIAVGIFCLVKPNEVARYFRSFARPIGRPSEKDIPLLQKQTEQLSARPILIRVVGFVLSCVGVFVLLGLLRNIYPNVAK